MLGLVVADGIATEEDRPCAERHVRRIEVLESPEADETGGWQGAWVERWTLDRCGVEVPYVVTFRQSSDGGVDFGINDVTVRG